MSSEATDLSSAGTKQDGDAPGVGGTSTEERVAAVGEGQAGEGGGADGSEGASPGEQEGGEREVREAPEKQESSAAVPEDVQRKLEQAEWAAATIFKDPKRAKAFEDWVREDQGGSAAAGSGSSSVYETMETMYRDPADREGIRRGIMEPMMREIEALRAEVRQLRPSVDKSLEVANREELAAALEAGGVPRAVQSGRDFQKWLASERRDPDVERDLRQRTRYAGKTLSRAWVAQQAQRNGWKAQSERVAAVKNGALGGGESANGNGFKKQVVIDDDGTDEPFKQFLAVRMKHGANVPVTMRFKPS